MACPPILRLCPAAGTLTLKFHLQQELPGQDALRRTFSAESDAVFARELQRRIAVAEASPRVPSNSVRQNTTRRQQQAWQTHQGGHSKLKNIIAAAAIGILVLGLIRQHRRPAPQQALLNPEGVLQHQVQQSFACPELRPGALKVCIQWLEGRRLLLEAEQTALQSLPPMSYQRLREKEIQSDLQSTGVIMSALMATLKQEERRHSKS